VFDGIRVVQVTNNDMPSIGVKVDGDYVVFTTKVSDEDNGWVINLYSVPAQTVTNLTPDVYGYNPDISGGIVTWTVMEEDKGQPYIYDIETQTTAKEGEWFRVEESPVIDETILPEEPEPEEPPITQIEQEVDAEEPVEEEVVEEEAVVEEEETVTETTESTSEEEEVIEEPEQVTEEDIMEELGITGDTGEEEIIEEEVDSIPEETGPEEVEIIPTEEELLPEETEESTPSAS